MNIAGNFPLTDPLAALLGEWAVTLNPYSVLLRVFMVVLLASIIGCERSSKRHSAGLRTFVLIAFSATTAMLLDQFLMAGHPTGLPLLCGGGSRMFMPRGPPAAVGCHHRCHRHAVWQLHPVQLPGTDQGTYYLGGSVGVCAAGLCCGCRFVHGDPHRVRVPAVHPDVLPLL